MSIFTRRKKKTPATEAEKPKKKTLAQKAAERAAANWDPPKLDKAAILAKHFQRKHDSLKPVTAEGVAMDEDAMAAVMDSSFDTTTLYPNDVPGKILEFYAAHGFIGWQACSLLRQNHMIDAACSIPAEDAMAPDYVLTYAENNKKGSEGEEKEVDEEKLVEIKEVSEDKFGIPGICQRLTINKKTFGIAIAIPVVDGADMSKPFNIDGIKKGTYKGFTIVEPYWVSPQLDADSASNPASLHFYEPTWWKIGGGKLVHRSWCIKVVNTVVPDILKPTYYYGGVPLTQMIYERVYAAEKTANEVPLLAMSKRMLIADADVENLIANPDEANAIVKAISYMRDNFAVWFKRQGDQVSQIDTSLGNLDEVIMTQYQLVASIAEMPATKLLKTTPKGFNATGEYEFKDYSQTLQEIQKHDFTPLIKMHNALYTKSKYGEDIPLVVTFNPVDAPTDKELAEVENIRAQVDSTYVMGGIVDPEEIRDIIRTEEGSRYSTLSDVSESQEDLDDDAEKLAGELLKGDEEKGGKKDLGPVKTTESGRQYRETTSGGRNYLD